MFRFKKGSKGFTLVELMVVMAILAVLATIVFPAVTGTKGPSESTQLVSDAQAVQSAANKYNNDSVSAGWPEVAVATKYSAIGEASLITTAVGGSLTSYTAVGWNATTNIRNEAGALVAVTFVPDYVPRTPASDAAVSGGKHVYVWLLKKGATTDAPTRTVEVYRLDDTGLSYSPVY